MDKSNFKIRLSEKTTLVLDIFQPTNSSSKELSIFLESNTSIQDLVMIREKLNTKDFTSDSKTMEILVWDDSDNESYTQRILVINQSPLTLVRGYKP